MLYDFYVLIRFMLILYPYKARFIIFTFMKYPTISLLTLIFFACSSPNKKDPTEIKSTPQTNNTIDTKWATYTDTINMGFVVSYKYPKTYVSEHFENALCIGKPVKAIDDGPMTSMDCSLWMDDISEGNVRPIDTLVQYEVDKLKESVQQSRDSISIANVKGLSVILTGKSDKGKIVKQMIYFTKYNTFFELINDSLSKPEFKTFLSSLRIEKTN
jgi:hypothetical protein